VTRLQAQNFAGVYQFPYATVTTDLFKKEDVQVLGLATDTHDHTPGLGKQIPTGGIADGAVTGPKLATGLLDGTALAGDLTGTLSNAHIRLANGSPIQAIQSTTQVRSLLMVDSADSVVFYNVGNGLFRYMNQGGTAELARLDSAGNFTSAQALGSTAGILNLATHTSVASDNANVLLRTDNGAVYVQAANGLIVQNNAAAWAPIQSSSITLQTGSIVLAAAGAVVQLGSGGPYWQNSGGTMATGAPVSAGGPISSSGYVSAGSGVLYLGPNDTSWQRNAANSMTTPGNVAIDGVLFVGNDRVAALQRQNIPNVGDSLSIAGKQVYVDNLIIGGTAQLTLYTTSDPQGGGQLFRTIGPSNRSAASVGGGEVHIGIRLFCDGDITSGTNMHAISFMQTSDPQLKANPVVLTDANCLARVKNTGPKIYTYQITPPVEGGFPAPTPTDIGMMATELYTASPELVALDSTGAAVAVSYTNMAALLWGAIRALEARVTAGGIA
jgi:hypothetical protein